MRTLMPETLAAEGPLSDAQLLEQAAAPAGTRPFVRFNMVTSLDGVGVLDGASGGLGSDADRRLFPLLRAVADAIVVGSGTVRAEGYVGELLPQELRAWRLDQGLPERPRTVILSASGSIDPQDPALVHSPERVLLLVSSAADQARVASLSAHAEVVVLEALEPAAITQTLTSAGLRHLHHEGGPSVLAQYLGADAVDSLCLTLSPVVAPGRPGAGIDDKGTAGALRTFALHRLYEEDSTLLADYRPRSSPETFTA